MARMIDAEKAIEIIEEKQKELCPVGRYGRHYVYGSDREKYDAWEEIIDALNNLPTLTQPNEPLTLEVLAKSQLLQMLGEKVEVIRMSEMCQAEWATVRSFGDCKTDSGCSCCHELYGKTWIAYRRPPEGEEEI